MSLKRRYSDQEESSPSPPLATLERPSSKSGGLKVISQLKPHDPTRLKKMRVISRSSFSSASTDHFLHRDKSSSDISQSKASLNCEYNASSCDARILRYARKRLNDPLYNAGQRSSSEFTDISSSETLTKEHLSRAQSSGAKYHANAAFGDDDMSGRQRLNIKSSIKVIMGPNQFIGGSLPHSNFQKDMSKPTSSMNKICGGFSHVQGIMLPQEVLKPSNTKNNFLLSHEDFDSDDDDDGNSDNSESINEELLRAASEDVNSFNQNINRNLYGANQIIHHNMRLPIIGEKSEKGFSQKPIIMKTLNPNINNVFRGSIHEHQKCIEDADLYNGEGMYLLKMRLLNDSSKEIVAKIHDESSLSQISSSDPEKF